MDNDDKERTMKGFMQWSKREELGMRMLSHADMHLYRVPFVLSRETFTGLAGLSDDAAKRELSSLMWRALAARNSRGGIPGSSYGAVSHSVEEIEYVPGAPSGHVTVGQSWGIGE